MKSTGVREAEAALKLGAARSHRKSALVGAAFSRSSRSLGGTVPTATDFQKKLVLFLGGQVAKILRPRLAEIIAAVEGEQRQASFSITMEFKPEGKANNPDGDRYKVVLKPRLRTPDPAIEIDLKVVDGQLSLYEAPDPLPIIEDEPDGAGDDAPQGNAPEAGDGAGATAH